MRLKVTFIFILMLFTQVMGADDAVRDTGRKEKVARATENAQRALLRKISQTPITAQLNVNAFIQKAGGSVLLDQTVRKAEQIGGARWVDSQTCQVRLEISGMRVSQTLLAIAQNVPDRSPINPSILQSELSDWKRLSFVATGTNLDLADLKTLDAGILAGREDAIGKLRSAIGQLTLPDGRKVYETSELEKTLDETLKSSPIDGIELSPGNVWSVALAVPAKDLADRFCKILKGQPNDSAWQAFEASLVAATNSIVGSAGRDDKSSGTIDFKKIDEPAWVKESISASAFSAAGPSRLLTARDAQGKAIDSLREKIVQLPIPGNKTLDAFDRSDRHVHDAINRALQRARVVKSEYHPDGGVHVVVELDAGLLWQGLKN